MFYWKSNCANKKLTVQKKLPQRPQINSCQKVARNNWNIVFVSERNVFLEAPCVKIGILFKGKQKSCFVINKVKKKKKNTLVVFGFECVCLDILSFSNNNTFN